MSVITENRAGLGRTESSKPSRLSQEKEIQSRVLTLCTDLANPHSRIGFFATPNLTENDGRTHLQARTHAFLAATFPHERPFLERIVNLADELHAGQYRQDRRTLYFTHPVGVADQLRRRRTKGAFITTTMLAEALLHDTREDWTGDMGDYESRFTEALENIHPHRRATLYRSAILFDDNASSPTYLPTIAKEGLATIKMEDRLNSSYGDLRKIIMLLQSNDADLTKARTRALRSKRKLEGLLPLHDTTPPDVVTDLAVTIAATDYLVQHPSEALRKLSFPFSPMNLPQPACA